MKTKWQAILFGAIFMVTMPLASRAQQAATPAPDQNAPAQVQAPQAPSAQDAAPNRPASMHLLKSLNLTPDQKTQLRAIHADRMNQLQALRNNATLTDQQRQQQFRQIRRSAHRQMVALLTPDQKAQLRQMIQQRSAARTQARPQSAPESAPQSPSESPDSAAPSSPSSPSNPQ